MGLSGQSALWLCCVMQRLWILPFLMRYVHGSQWNETKTVLVAMLASQQKHYIQLTSVCPGWMQFWYKHEKKKIFAATQRRSIRFIHALKHTHSRAAMQPPRTQCRQRVPSQSGYENKEQRNWLQHTHGGVTLFCAQDVITQLYLSYKIVCCSIIYCKITQGSADAYSLHLFFPFNCCIVLSHLSFCLSHCTIIYIYKAKKWLNMPTC